MKELNIVSTKVRNPQTGEFESIFMGGANEGGSGGTTDYNELSNKPKINGVTLTGNKTIHRMSDIYAVSFRNTARNVPPPAKIKRDRKIKEENDIDVLK